MSDGSLVVWSWCYWLVGFRETSRGGLGLLTESVLGVDLVGEE